LKQRRGGKNIISALTQAAPQMAALSEGDYDVRPALLEATELAINARRNNQSLLDVIAQQDLVSQDPVSRDIMQLFANNPRSAKKIGEGLKRIAEAANTEATKSLEPDMFGDVPARRSLAEVVAEAVVEPQLEGDVVR
jgi:predicted O-linked N-acetylglucosamine transferase (SPINDLY family)